MKSKRPFEVEGKLINLSSLDKLLWKDPPITKADLINYFITAAPAALPYWQNRPLTLTRYPNGIEQEGFYQKNCPEYAPTWVKTYKTVADRTSVEYIVCNDLATLVWLANQAVIEVHPATYLANDPEHPSFAIIDLDPTAPLGFEAARDVALKIKVILDQLGLRGYPKTSGATGVHIYIPLKPQYTFDQTSLFVEIIGKLLIKFYPNLVTNERLVRNRRGVYIDHLQNQPGKTIVGVYSPRPLPGAPVSTPVEWDELARIDPSDFTVLTLPQRLKTKGDLFAPVLRDQQTIDHVFDLLSAELR